MKSSHVTVASALKPDDNVLNDALKTQATKRPGMPGYTDKVSITKYGISYMNAINMKNQALSCFP